MMFWIFVVSVVEDIGIWMEGHYPCATVASRIGGSDGKGVCRSTTSESALCKSI
jgi:hypothetical protein